MLKLNEANRQKVMELSHVHNGKFSGIWERCMFLMMAPLFSRYELHLGLAAKRSLHLVFVRCATIQFSADVSRDESHFGYGRGLTSKVSLSLLSAES